MEHFVVPNKRLRLLHFPKENVVSISIPFEFRGAPTRPGQGQIDAHDVQGRISISVPYQIRSRGKPAVVAALQSPDVVAPDLA